MVYHLLALSLALVASVLVAVILVRQRRLTADLEHRAQSLAEEVAQRRQVEVELRQSEERLRQATSVYENTAEGIMITDVRSVIIAVNPAFSAITGYGESEILGRSPRLLQSHQQSPLFYQDLWRTLRDRGHWQGELWYRRNNGETHPVWQSVSVVRDAEGRVVNYVTVFTDISAIKETQARLQRLAHHDHLTGLPNRQLLLTRLEQAMTHARRQESRIFLLFLDLDRFKNLNDTLGHPAGDQLLREVARRLPVELPGQITVARLGGDEFVLLLEGRRGLRDATPVAESLLENLCQPYRVQGHEVFISASIGIGLFPDDGDDCTTLLRNAEAAMYQAKEQGRNTYRYYTRALTAAAVERFSLETSLRRALEREEFVLHYQPQVDLKSGQVVAVEALIRWRHPQRGLVPPNQFIHLAEECGLILPIDEWVLHTACRHSQTWRQAGLNLGAAVNVSGAQLVGDRLLRLVRRVLNDTGMDPRCLELEISENFLMRHVQDTISSLGNLRDLGITLAIDDFGTGYSSLSYLKRLPVDKLKIDQSFVRDIPVDGNDAAIARAVIALGRSLQLTVIAEGVETAAQWEFMCEAGCDQVQGFWCGRPIADISEFSGLSMGQDPPLGRDGSC